MECILNQLDPVSTFTSYYLKTQFNIILSIESTTPKRPLFFRNNDYGSVCISRLPMLAKYSKSVLLLDTINLLMLAKEWKLWTATLPYWIPCKNSKEVSLTFLSYILGLISNRLLTTDFQIISQGGSNGAYDGTNGIQTNLYQSSYIFPWEHHSTNAPYPYFFIYLRRPHTV